MNVARGASAIALLSLASMGAATACGGSFTDDGSSPTDAGFTEDATSIAIGQSDGAPGATVGDDDGSPAGTSPIGVFDDGGTVTGFDSAVPVTAPDGGPAIVAIAAGFFMGCALRANGVVSCWGDDQYGELGFGPAPLDGGYPAPHVIPFGTLGTPVQIGAGKASACALLSNGSIACWGRNDWARVSYPSDAASPPVPTPVLRKGIGNSAPITNAVGMTIGSYVTCALTGAGVGSFAAECWGQSTTDDTLQSTSGQIQPVLALPSSLGAFQELALDYGAGCILSGGIATCWGEWTGTQATAPAKITKADHGALDHLVQVTSGRSFACALRDDESVWCWGHNQYGQCGIGSQTVVPSPAGPTFPAGSGVVQIASGYEHSCALLKNGDVYCWGLDNNHQVGTSDPSSTVCTTGSTPCEPHPALKTLGFKVERVALGEATTLVLTSDNEVYGWGQTSVSQTGIAPKDGGETCTSSLVPCSNVPNKVLNIP